MLAGWSSGFELLADCQQKNITRLNTVGTHESRAVAIHLVADLDGVRSRVAVDAEAPADITIFTRIRDLGDEHALRVDVLHVLLVVIIGLTAMRRLAFLASFRLRFAGSHDGDVVVRSVRGYGLWESGRRIFG